MSTWIDFKALREKLDFEQVLQQYGVEVKRKGNQHMGFCPLPNHQGKRNSPSFSANLERGIFQCFGCGAKGNVIEFATYMEKLDPTIGRELLDVARRLKERFVPDVTMTKTHNPKAGLKAKKSEVAKPELELLRLVNEPLDFELKDLDFEHPYLLKRGFTTETLSYFGVGFCRRGFLKDRVAIPLHDHDFKLVGYAGRVVDDSLITEENPRYKLPGERKREGKIFEFRKTLFLYNGFRILTPVDDLFVVESFTSVWWLTQNGLAHIVGTMGADCSDTQAELIVSFVKPNGRVWIISDGDPAGERHAHSVFVRVAPLRSVRLIKLGPDEQPTDYPGEFFRGKLKS